MQKIENLGIIGLLCRSVGNPCRGVNLRHGVGYPHRGEAEVLKHHPSGTPRHSIAATQRSYYSQRAIYLFLFFWFFVSEHLVFVHRRYRNPNKLLIGVKIRMKLSEKRIVPRRLDEIH